VFITFLPLNYAVPENVSVGRSIDRGIFPR
jgi:hypothetical protein